MRRRLSLVQPKEPALEPMTRPRVIARLREAFTFPVALVVAPAGFGKSIALRHALVSCGELFARYDVRSDNVGLLGFARGLAKALEPFAPHLSTTLADAHKTALAADSPAPIMAEWLRSQIEGFGGIIAVDDFHVAASDPQVCAFVSEVIERAGDSARWVIATRDTGDLPVASWRGYQRAGAPVDERDLAFSAEEGRQVLVGTCPAQRAEDFNAIYELTRGWPLAMRLAADISASGETLAEVASGTRAMVYRFLAEQVFRALSEREKTFLLETCVYPSVDIALLTNAGIDDAAHIVESIRRRTSFLPSEVEGVFVYHDLVREYLEHELRDRGGRAFTSALERCASALECAGHYGEALQRYVRASAHAQLADLLCAHGLDLIEANKSDLVALALPVLREGECARPLILAVQAVLSFNAGRTEQGEATFERALETADDGLVRAVIADAYGRVVGNRDPTRVITILGPHGENEALPAELQARICSSLACGYIIGTGDAARAARLMRRALGLLSSTDRAELRAVVYARRGVCAFFTGDTTGAHEFCGESALLAERTGLFATASSAYSILAMTPLDVTDEPALAADYSRRRYDCAVRSWRREFRAGPLWVLAHIASERGDRDALAQIDAEMANLGLAAGPMIGEQVGRVLALRSAWEGDFQHAFVLLEARDTRFGPMYWRALCWAELALYAAAAAKGEVAQSALAAAERDIALVTSDVPNQSVFRAMTFCALALLMLGKMPAARRSLEEVEANRRVLSKRMRTFVKAARAVYAHAQTGLAANDVAAALAEMRANDYGGYAALLEKLPIPQPDASGFATLTEAELQVLQALGRGETSLEIATASGRKKGTIDEHVESIRRKLGCTNRRSAIALARQHGLIP